MQVMMIAPERIRPSAFNPRKQFAAESLKELAVSLKQVGILEPLLVRPRTSGGAAGGSEAAESWFEIVAGERRYRAALLAELAEIPCLVRELDDTAALEHAVLENLQREDLQPLEEAEGFASLIEHGGYTVNQLADRLGKSVRHVYGRLALRKLAPELVEAVATKRLPASACELIMAAAGDETWVEQNHRRQVELVQAAGLLAEGGDPLSVREIKRRLRDQQTEADRQTQDEESAEKERREKRRLEGEARQKEREAADRAARKQRKQRLQQLGQAVAKLAADELLIRLAVLRAVEFDEFTEDVPLKEGRLTEPVGAVVKRLRRRKDLGAWFLFGGDVERFYVRDEILTDAFGDLLTPPATKPAKAGKKGGRK